ncbi:MAG: hypothetical protein IT439_11870 [Phycisphaerales bacterium]|nr:hypothetical protein [Phycisphaerales bacterium]
MLERAWNEPYGTPHGMSPADFSGTSDDTNDHYLVPDGDADADDSFVYLDLFGVSAALSDMTGSSDPGDGEYGRPNGTVDSDDYFYFLDQYSAAANLGRNVLSAGHDGATASHRAGNLRNRRGLAGYEWDPHVRRYHVRNRVLYPEIGRWTRRDPMGYVDGMGVYEHAQSATATLADPYGLFAASRPGDNWACEYTLYRCRQDDPAVRQIQESLDACSPGFVYNIRCASDVNGFSYYNCSANGKASEREILILPGSTCDVLVHELSHALDDCRSGGDCSHTTDPPTHPGEDRPTNCNKKVCTELRAYNRAGQCCTGGSRRLPGETACECLFRQARRSVEPDNCRGLPMLLESARKRCVSLGDSPCPLEIGQCIRQPFPWNPRRSGDAAGTTASGALNGTLRGA